MLESQSLSSAVAIDDHHIIITGGYDGEKDTPAVEILNTNGERRKCKQLEDMTKARRRLSSAYMKGLLYVIGEGNGSSKSIEILKINTKNINTEQKWENISNMKESTLINGKNLMTTEICQLHCLIQLQSRSTSGSS